MKNVCPDLKEHATKIINYQKKKKKKKKKKMIPLTNEERKLHRE